MKFQNSYPRVVLVALRLLPWLLFLLTKEGIIEDEDVLLPHSLISFNSV